MKGREHVDERNASVESSSGGHHYWHGSASDEPFVGILLTGTDVASFCRYVVDGRRARQMWHTGEITGGSDSVARPGFQYDFETSYEHDMWLKSVMLVTQRPDLSWATVCSLADMERDTHESISFKTVVDPSPIADYVKTVADNRYLPIKWAPGVNPRETPIYYEVRLSGATSVSRERPHEDWLPRPDSARHAASLSSPAAQDGAADDNDFDLEARRLRAVRELAELDQARLALKASEAGRSQREIARLLGTSQTQVHRVLRRARAAAKADASPREIVLRYVVGEIDRRSMLQTLSGLRHGTVDPDGDDYDSGPWDEVRDAYLDGLVDDEDYAFLIKSSQPPTDWGEDG